MKKVCIVVSFIIMFFVTSPSLISAWFCSAYYPSPSCDGSSYDGGCDCPSGRMLTCCTSATTYDCVYYENPIPYGCSYAKPFKCTSSTIGNYCYQDSRTCSCEPSCTATTCTPSCPAGQSTTVTGDLCKQSLSSCTYTRSDCSTGTTTGGYCYLPETNVTPSTPTSISLIVDGVTYQLSTNADNPTKIKLPSNGTPTVQVSLPTFTPPSTSRGGGYYIRANNYGVNNEWSTVYPWGVCGGDVGEDFCTSTTSATSPFTPSSLTVLQVLKENAKGKIAGLYYTTNKCNDDVLYSLPIEGYYEIDEIPETIDTTLSNLLPEVGVDTTTKGCTSTTYSGKEVNNPLHIVATTSDNNSNDEIQALVMWLSADTSVPSSASITSSYTGTDSNDIGIMIRKNGSSWSNPLIYATNSSLNWGPITDMIQISGEDVIRLEDLSINTTAGISFDFNLEFLDTTNTPSDLYSLYSTVLDSYMINGGVTDLSYMTKIMDWGIDLVNPSVDDITQALNDPQTLYITWNTQDGESGVNTVVINGYRTGGINTDTVELFLPSAYTISKGEIILNEIPEDSLIGMLTDTNSWQFTTSTGETDLLNIGDNEQGTINLYISAFDQACNTNAATENIDLNPWVTSKGGFVYTQNGFGNGGKDVSSVSDLDGVFEKLTKEELDLGTEVISSRYDYLSNLIHPELGGVKAMNLYDSNNRKSYWFEHLHTKLNQQSAIATAFVLEASDTKTSDRCSDNYCYEYSTDNISIPSGFLCDKTTLFMTEGNIYLEPDITSNGSNTGCLFVAKGNIYITDGTYKTAGYSNIHYDYIDALLFAENTIQIPLADQTETLRDGLEVNGAMIAIGSGLADGASAINVERNLRLYNQVNPTLVLNYDVKYAKISEIFFGTEAPLYKQEIGFKTF